MDEESGILRASYARVRITVENRDYHHLSQSEIAGAKRIYEHLSGGSRGPQILTDFAALLVRLALLGGRDDEDPAFSRDQESKPESLDCWTHHCAAVLDSRKRTTSDSEWLRRTTRVLPLGE